MTYDQFVGGADFRRHYRAQNHLGWHSMRRTNPTKATAPWRLEGPAWW